MMSMTDVVKNLLIINVIIFFAVNFLIPIPNIQQYFVLYRPFTLGFEPVQIVTHMFSHANISHLFFNMLGLYMFGSMVEATLGPKRFLILYLTSGLAASALQMLLSPSPILGASGAVFGITTAFATMFPNTQLMLLFPPIPMKAKYMAILFIGVGLYSGLSGTNDGIAHFAHVGGALWGFLMIIYWKQNNLR
ncbi:MAG: rhomboid family intramembrane serine protease [Saprospiraceae bacterium]|jgi:membrane associated rhomboid family serine protease|nr:rhomboid family intramembrane serine protease [Saprospiraceae bacterium]